jgi:hypothetical protein
VDQANQEFEALVFDAYGTLFDVDSVTGACEEVFPGRGEVLSRPTWPNSPTRISERRVCGTGRGPGGGVEGSARLGVAQVHVWLRILQSTCPLPPTLNGSVWPMNLRADGGRDKHSWLLEQ